MRDRVLICRIRWGRKTRGQQLRQALGTNLRAIHANEMLDASGARGSGADLRSHVVGLDHDARRVIGKVIVELVHESNVDQRRNGANAPAGKQAEQVIHAVMREDGNAVALALVELLRLSGVPFYRRHVIRESEFNTAIDPTKRNLVWCT